jgi:hypothetical protein
MDTHRRAPRLALGACTTALALLALGACGKGDPNGGVTSTTLNPPKSPTIPSAPIDANTTSEDPVPADTLPIVPTPALPGNVPIGSVWVGPGAVAVFGTSGPKAADAVYNKLGSATLSNDLAMLAQANPNFIASSIALIGKTNSGRLVYNVTLYDAVTAVPSVVAVDNLILADSNRKPLDGLTLSEDGRTRITWPALYTKALALKLGGYDNAFNTCVPMLAGKDFAPSTSMYHVAASDVAQILATGKTGIPIRTESLVVSNGQALTSTGPANSNVTVNSFGPTFVCEITNGAKAQVNICLQANALHYVVDYNNFGTTVRNIYSSTAGSAYDGLYGWHGDGTVTLPLNVFIDLTDRVTPLSGVLTPPVGTSGAP